MDYSSYQHQDSVYWNGGDPSWFNPDPAASTFDEVLVDEQQFQFTPTAYNIQPFDPLMGPLPVDEILTLTPVPMDVAPDPGLPSVNPPEGPAVGHAEPENVYGFGWNVEGEWLANEELYEHSLGLSFDEPRDEGDDVGGLDLGPGPDAKTAVKAAMARQADTGLNDAMGVSLPESSSAHRDTVSTPSRRSANAARRANPFGHTIPCQWSGCKSTFTREHNRTEHMKLHFNLREYWCDVGACEQRFNTASLLKSHRFRIHGIRPAPRAGSI